MKVRDIFADKKLKGKGNNAVYKHQRPMPGPTLHARRFVVLVISPHFPFFPRYPSVSHAAELPIPTWGVEEQKAFPGQNTSAAKVWRSQSESTKTLGEFLLTRTHSTLRTLFLLQAHTVTHTPCFITLLPSSAPIFTHFPAPYPLSRSGATLLASMSSTNYMECSFKWFRREGATG